MSRFGSPHGYGIPAILNSWREKKEQEKQEQFYNKKLDLDRDELEFKKNQFQAQMDEKKAMRQAKVTADGFKLMDSAFKMYDRDGMFETAQSMMKEGLGRVKAAYPEMGDIDISGVADAKEAKEKIKEQTEKKFNDAWVAYTNGDDSVLPALKQTLPRAMKMGLVDKDTADFYIKQIESGKKDKKPLSPEGKLQQDIEEGFVTQEQVDKQNESSDDKEPMFQQKIKQLMDAYGVDEKEATGLVQGVISVVADPVSGTRYLVNKIDGSEKKISSNPVEQPKPEPQSQPEQTLFELADLVAGPVSAAKAGGSKVSGMFGGPVATQVEQARQYVVTSKNDLIRSLSINPKYPVSEIKRIEKEINIEPQLFDNPQSLKNRMIAIDKSLSERIRKEEKIQSDDNMPVVDRRNAAKAIADITHFRNIMGVPTQIATAEDYYALPNGETYIDPEGNVRVKGE